MLMQTLKTLIVVLFGSFLVIGLIPPEGLAGPIAYSKPNVYGGRDIWLINPDRSGNRRIPVSANTLASADQPVWSRDGRLIAATGVVPGGVTQVITVFAPNGGQVRVLSKPVSLYAIFKAFSPDGQWLAFASLALNFAEFGVTRLDGTGSISLGFRDNTEGLSGFGIDWSPTRNDLLVASATALDFSCLSIPASVTKLFLVPPVRGGLDRALPLTSPRLPCPGEVYDVFPAFSRDGRRVAFVRLIADLSGLFETRTQTSIHVINVDRTNERAVIRFPVQPKLSQLGVHSLSWSGDGRRLIFSVGTPSSDLGIWTINVDGTGLRQFLPAPADNPAWSWVP